MYEEIDMSVLFAAGIYVLYREGRAIYVGKTTNLGQRLRKHRSDGVEFDKVLFKTCREEDLSYEEFNAIEMFWPEKNKMVTAREHGSFKHKWRRRKDLPPRIKIDFIERALILRTLKGKHILPPIREEVRRA